MWKCIFIIVYLACASFAFVIDLSRVNSRVYNSLQHPIKCWCLHAIENDDDDDFSLHLNSLQLRIEEQQSQYMDFLLSEDEISNRSVEEVHIILFHAGTEQQGVHTIEFPKGSGKNYLLAFEILPECEQFMTSLQQEGNIQFQNAMTAECQYAELKEFCDTISVQVRIVPEGRSIRPPDDVVDDLSMEEEDIWENPSTLSGYSKEQKSTQHELSSHTDNSLDSEEYSSLNSWQ
jgi:Protein of unknown function (DUF3110)